MGLDITAYRGLKAAPHMSEHDRDEHGWSAVFVPWDAHSEWAEENFPGRAEGIDQKNIQTFEEVFRFRSGSYSEYNEWRRLLCKLVDREFSSSAPGPFSELIYFADNEGVLGPVVSAKLSCDFSDYADRAAAFADGLDPKHSRWWLESYQQWRRAMEMAADRGAVVFQ